MKSINQYINERGAAPRIDLSKRDIYFSQKEIDMIMKDMNDRNGQFYEFIKDKVDSLSKEDINDYLDQCLDDDRCTAEFAAYIEMIIGRRNFSLEQVQQFINEENLKR